MSFTVFLRLASENKKIVEALMEKFREYMPDEQGKFDLMT